MPEKSMELHRGLLVGEVTLDGALSMPDGTVARHIETVVLVTDPDQPPIIPYSSPIFTTIAEAKAWIDAGNRPTPMET